VKSSVEKINETSVRINVEVSWDELQPHLSNAYDAISARVNIPGFRKGKVPKAMIDQRVGRVGVLDEMVSAALPFFYQQASMENKLKPLGRPVVDVKELVDNEKFVFDVEVDVRPEFSLPNFSEMTLEVDDVVVSETEIQDQIDGLRARFGTLTAVEKVVEKGDFVLLDLVATINGEEIEGGVARDISYEVGSSSMIEGLDEALIGLSAGENKDFKAPLVGMAEGETGDIAATVKAVKRRDLPELNDEFAKLSSEFETLAELTADITTRMERFKAMEQGSHARDLLMEKLNASVNIPIPTKIIEQEVHDHLEKEGRLEDEEHRKEVTDQTVESLKQELLLDAIVEAEQVTVNEGELTEYIVRAAARYQVSPDQFIKEISEAGQINTVVAEVTRAKALAGALARAKVVTKSGKVVDLEALRPQTPAEAE
jgi:trigger factor